jgi:flagellar biosynthesis/type III secretory pathway M-ring protein FliF/YscJ
MSFDTVRRQLARNVVRHAAKHAKKKLSHEFQPGGDLDLTAMGQQDSSEGATLVLGGLAISVALMLAAFVVFSLVRDMQRSDAEIEKAREGASRGVIQAKSFRGWAVLGIVICVLVMKHIHHISTQPALTHEQAVHMVKAPIEENPTVRALTMGGTHTEEEARQKIHEHIQANPHLLAPRKIYGPRPRRLPGHRHHPRTQPPVLQAADGAGENTAW